MAQALINNLNTIQEASVNLQDKMQKTEGIDFGKIFDSKTKDCNNKSELKTDSNIYNAQKNSDLCTRDNTENSIAETNYNSTSQISTQETEVQDTTVINSEIPVTENIDLNNTDIENIENIITEEELNIIEEEITQDTIITDEEPTMNNELTTLQDPTAVLLLQSQIQKNVTSNLENEKEDLTNEGLNLKTNNQNQSNLKNDSSNNNLAIFKQFESTKDTNPINLTPKENIHTKAESKTSSVISENMVKEMNVEVLSAQSAETETSAGDLMQNQLPQDHTARIMIQGDIKFDSVAQESLKSATQVKTTDVTPSKIIEQISKQLDGMINNSKLNMVLNPGNLGKVNLQLVNTKAGLMAQFTVITQDAKELLMKGLDGLKESLLAQGISVDNVSVKLEETDSEYKFDWTEQEGSKGGNKQQFARKQKENEKQFEQMMFELENEVNV